MKLTAEQQNTIISAFDFNSLVVASAIAESSNQLKTLDPSDSHLWAFMVGGLACNEHEAISDAAHEAFSRLNKIVQS